MGVLAQLCPLPAGEECCLRPSLVQLVKEDVEQERKLTGDRSITAVCYLTPETSKHESSGK